MIDNLGPALGRVLAALVLAPALVALAAAADGERPDAAAVIDPERAPAGDVETAAEAVPEATVEGAAEPTEEVAPEPAEGAPPPAPPTAESEAGDDQAAAPPPAPITDPEAQYLLGLGHQTGDGVVKNHALAWRWFQKAARQDHVPAQLALAAMYETGSGMPLDYAAAAEWYRRAAEAGDRHAQARLGRLYRFGFGVPRNSATAARWLGRAAAAGDAGAQHQLDEMAWLGILPIDPARRTAAATSPAPPADEPPPMEPKLGHDLPSVDFGGEIEVVEREGGSDMVVPRLSLRAEDGGWIVIGVVRIALDEVGEADDGVVRFEVTLPGRIDLLDQWGARVATVTYETETFEGLWSEPLQTVVSYDGLWRHFQGYDDDGRGSFDLDELLIAHSLNELTPGAWSGPSSIQARGFRAYDMVDGVVVSLGRFSFVGETVDLALADYRQSMSELGFDPLTGLWDPARVAGDLSMIERIPAFLGGGSVEIAVEELEIQSVDRGRLMALDRGAFGLGYEDFREPLAAVRLDFGYRGLSVVDADLAGQAVAPSEMTIALGLDRIPTAALSKALLATATDIIANAEALEGASEDEIMNRIMAVAGGDLEAAVLAAGTRFLIPNLSAEAPAFALEGDGLFAADGAAARKVTGELELVVRGLEAIAADPAAVGLDPELVMGLGFFVALGESVAEDEGSEEAEGGGGLTRYRLEILADGRILFNDQDISPMLADTGFDLGPPSAR
ncbi:MAG: tetratricopeptide repeat protein [Alphaproteobacteria bacterium]|nr:tetratricopeptide repeat protein [Alphaproteobacteria bacterium]MDP6515764.1 tetratricopeptide repeat protein [Alphaproteobacteria bacterium]